MPTVKGHFDRQTQAYTDTHNRPTLKLHYLITTAVPGCNNCQARRQEMKWGGVFFCKKWTFSQRTVHYVQYQYFFYFTFYLFGGCVNVITFLLWDSSVCMHPTHPPLPTGLKYTCASAAKKVDTDRRSRAIRAAILVATRSLRHPQPFQLTDGDAIRSAMMMRLSVAI